MDPNHVELLQSALAVYVAAGRPDRRSWIQRAAEASRYAEPLLITAAAGIWLHNLTMLLSRSI